MQYLGKGIDAETGFGQQARTDYAPYTGLGASAVGPLGDLLGLNGPEAAQKAMDALKASPMFTSLFNTGQEAVLQNASATGGVRGGNTQGALYELGSNTLSQLVSDQLSRLGGVANLGASATGAQTAAGSHVADAIAALFGKQGDAQASKYLTKGGINSQNWNNAGGFLDSAVSAFLPGGGGFASIF